ncbi:MAG: type II secretion system protein GspD, partial [Bdellovibrionales bacterium]
GKNSSGSLNISGIPFLGDIGASLNIAEGGGYAKVVSSPKVVTISGKKASITRNAPILIAKSVTTSLEGNTTETRETQDVRIQLDVTPTVTSQGSVFLDVSVDREDAGGPDGSFKIARTAKTEVLVQNGHTIVIGGIYEEEQVKNSDGIPFLRKVPFLNLLFNQFQKTKSKSELLVFLTPKLLDINE